MGSFLFSSRLFVTNIKNLRILDKVCTIILDMKHKLVNFLILALASLLLVALVTYRIKPPPQIKVFGVVVPHHDLVAGQRSELFKELLKQVDAGAEPSTIVLVSPNHYLSGKGRIQTTDKTWTLQGEQILPDKNVISGLLKTGLVYNQQSTLESEHGIYNILNDIHTYFPNAKLVPLVLTNPSLKELENLNKSLLDLCPNCLMISSVDFSHYQPANLAELHDQKTILDLSTLNTLSLLTKAEVDSGQTLALLTLWVKSHNTQNFRVLNQTNSSLLLGNPDLEGTSHVFGWYQSGWTIKPNPIISFVFSNKQTFGVENRTIWGVDNFYPESFSGAASSKIIVAGKVTKNSLEFFGLPLDPKNSTKLATGQTKQELLQKFYEPYKQYLVSSPSGDYIKIPLSEELDLAGLSQKSLKDIIKLTINQNNDNK